jgi:hypothetical protein
MKKLFAAMAVCVFIAGAVHAQTATRSCCASKAGHTTAATEAKMCDGTKCADADKDGICDYCKAAFPKSKASTGMAAAAPAGCAGEHKAGTGCSKQGQPVQGSTGKSKAKSATRSCCANK